jgi:isopentenyl-diphosphate delta-isomerase
MSKQLVLVDRNDEAIGVGGKEMVHREGQLHRAFSVFVFDASGRLLLQQRAEEKYHSGGLWSNTCCSHPGPGEPVVSAARRRLQEEMGFSCSLRPVFGFVYRVELENDIIEHEYDHVLVGNYEGTVKPNPEEVAGWKWVDPLEVMKELKSDGSCYTYWFKIAFERLLASPPAEMEPEVS